MKPIFLSFEAPKDLYLGIRKTDTTMVVTIDDHILGDASVSIHVDPKKYKTYLQACAAFNAVMAGEINYSIAAE